MEKLGAIIVNGYFETEGTLHQTESLKKELNKLGVEIDVLKSNKILRSIKKGKIEVKIKNYDFIVFLDKDIHLAKMLESLGFTLFNSRSAIELCDDKILTHITLSNFNINMPLTIPSTIMYSETNDIEFLQSVEERLNYPIIVKKAYGSMGKGVFKANNYRELKELFNSLRLYPHMYQEYINCGYGKDIRVIVIGGKVVASMLRTNLNDFRSNVELGGSCENYILNLEERKMAERAASILGLDFAGVDILTKDGVNYLCEVNSNALFKGITEATKVNIAKAYASHIYKSIYKK